MRLVSELFDPPTYVHYLRQDLSMSTKFFLPSDLDLEVWPIFILNFILGHSFLTRRGRAFIFYLYIPCDKSFLWVPFWPNDLDIYLEVFNNFNLGHSFVTRRGRAFIFHMCISCSKIFKSLSSSISQLLHLIKKNKVPFALSADLPALLLKPMLKNSSAHITA